VSCAENPRTGAEQDPPLSKELGMGRKAIVVGAGPGGIAAAMLLDQAGFETHIYERRPFIGGGIIVSATPPGKDKLFWYNQYLEKRLENSQVNVHLNHDVCAQDITAQNPDLVIVAAGTARRDMDIPGIDK